MARINIEEEAWKRLYRLADLMDLPVHQVIGPVVCLWSNSQDQVKVFGDKKEIIEWANLFKTDQDFSEKFFSALEKVSFISLHENGAFKIHGNDIQLESLARHRAKSAKGGKALKKKLAAAKVPQANHRQASGMALASHRGLKAIQSNTKQSNSNQDNALQVITTQNNAENLSASHSQKTKVFVARYCENFKIRYGSNPIIKGKESGIAKRLAKDLSEEKITLYLDAFFQMPDSFLVKSKHPLALFETKFNEVTVFAHSGQFTTMKQARQVDDAVNTQNILQMIENGEI